jgi:hypothetical protein
MRGALQTTLGRLPSTHSGSRWPSWLTVLTRERRWPAERLETAERLQRQRRQALSRRTEHPELRWLRRY